MIVVFIKMIYLSRYDFECKCMSTHSKIYIVNKNTATIILVPLQSSD